MDHPEWFGDQLSFDSADLFLWSTRTNLLHSGLGLVIYMRLNVISFGAGRAKVKTAVPYPGFGSEVQNERSNY